MPVLRRRLRRRTGDGEIDSPRTRFRLAMGHDWPELPGDALTEVELRQAWRLLRSELRARIHAGRGLLDVPDVCSVLVFALARPRRFETLWAEDLNV